MNVRSFFVGWRQNRQVDATAPTRTPRSDRLYHFLRRHLTPDLRNSQYAYADELSALAGCTPRWLDLGCGHDIVPGWAGRSVKGLHPLVGIDVDVGALALNSRVRWRVAASGESLPFDNAAFGLVTANMVLEHVARPETLFSEVERVLMPNGVFLVHTPNVHGYTTVLTRLIPSKLRAPLASALQGRRSEDVYPTYYRANSAATLRRLAEHAGFEVRTLTYVVTSPQLFRVAPLLVPEMFLIRALLFEAMSPLRPCLIATFHRRRAR